MSARRSCLSVPGSSEKMLGKASETEADEIVIDLEDAVAPNAKEEARDLVCEFLADDPLPHKSVAVRINALDTAWGEADVAQLAQRAGEHIDSLVVPMVERGARGTRRSALR